MKHQKLKIVYRNYGIADRFEDGTVELHKGLNDYPELKKSIITHELRHTDQKGFTKRDLLHDLSTPDQIKTATMLKFMIKNPSSLVQFLPIYWVKKRGWIVDLNLIIIYSVIAAIVAAVMFFGFLF